MSMVGIVLTGENEMSKIARSVKAPAGIEATVAWSASSAKWEVRARKAGDTAWVLVKAFGDGHMAKWFVDLVAEKEVAKLATEVRA
jgi:hypothetical protein